MTRAAIARARGAIACTAAAGIVLAGCGGEERSAEPADTTPTDPALVPVEEGKVDPETGAAEDSHLQHVDGTITEEEGAIVVATDSGAERRLLPGPELEQARVAALAASGQKARVYYAGNIAASVSPVPEPSQGAQSATGTVTSVEAGELTIETADGPTTFTIRPADQEAFEVGHLDEHRHGGDPIKVFYEQQGDTRYGLSYEDA